MLHMGVFAERWTEESMDGVAGRFFLLKSPRPHQLVFNEVTHDFVVEVLDGGPADALLHILLLGVQ